MNIFHLYLIGLIKKFNYIFFIVFYFCLPLDAQIQQPLNCSKVESNLNSDLTQVILFSSTSGIISGKKILILENGSWNQFEKQPPVPVNLIDAKNKNSIFISSITEYQESEIFYWNGKTWEKYYHPLANNITDFHFENKSNGIICGLGEIAILEDSKWKFLPPPSNNYFTKIIKQNNSVIWVLSPGEGIFKYNTEWQKIKNSEKATLIKLFNDKIYTVGLDFLGVVESDSIKIIGKNKKLQNVFSFDVLDTNYIIAVGRKGLIINFSGNQFKTFNSDVRFNLNSVAMINRKEGWIAGNDGTILHLSDKKLYRQFTNNWQGFEQITFYSYAKVVDDGYGVVAEDFNNDDRTDLFICGLYENNHLYINKGNLHFVDEATERSITNKTIRPGGIRELNLGACAGDFDNDGEIDIYVSSLTTQNNFYHNLGNGYFVDYTQIANCGGKSYDRTNAVITGDVNNDGSLDIFICNENTTNRLFINNGAGIFAELTKDVNLVTKFGGTGASFSDIDSDGDLDLYVANWSDKNRLYKNLLAETGILKFRDFTDSAGVGGEVYTKSNGVVFADIDNDADMDLFVTNRKTSNKLYLNNGNGFYKDVTINFLGEDSLKSYGAVIADFDNDGFKDLYLANVGKNKFYKNLNGKKFIDQTELYGANVNGYSTGLAFADFDNDKFIDLYVANYIGSSSTILRNKPNSTKTVILKLYGIKDNASAVGTKIFAYNSKLVDNNSNLIYYTEVNGGSGYASMNDLTQTIPCINNEQIDIKVIFPSGKTLIKNYVRPGSIITINDIEGYNKRFFVTKKYLTRLLFDPHRLYEFLKWILIFFLLGISTLLGIKKYSWSYKIIIAVFIFVITAYYLFQSFLEFENIFFSSILPITSIIIFLGIVHLSSERIKLKKKNEIEKQKLREKLSRDLHDDLASTLSSATIYLELLKQSLNNKSTNVWTFLDKTENLLVKAKQTITDLIWTIKPKPENVIDFITRVRENFINIFREKNIHLEINEIKLSENEFLSPIQKHNIYLIIKESLNNILKHSKATEVKINVEQITNKLQFSIIDNGIGFEKEKISRKGNGLINIIKRSKETNADISIESELGKGTKIQLKLK